MTRRTKRTAVLVLAVGGLLALGGMVAGPDKAGAFGVPVVDDGPQVDDPVSYTVGDVLVFSTRTRNESCSVTRNVRNDGDVPVQVLGSATWDGQPVHTPPNQGGFVTGGLLAPGEQVTAQWTNHGYVTDGQLWLTWSVIDPDDPDPFSVGDNFLELVPACTPAPPETSTTAPPEVTVPTVATTVPTTVPVTLPSEPAPPFEVATTTTVAVEVLASSLPARSLPATGLPGWVAPMGATLVLAGVVLVLAARGSKDPS